MFVSRRTWLWASATAIVVAFLVLLPVVASLDEVQAEIGATRGEAVSAAVMAVGLPALICAGGVVAIGMARQASKARRRR